MKAQVKTLDGGFAKDIELPELFSEEYRPDLIKKAVMALQSTRRQPHGTNPYAGICSSAVGWAVVAVLRMYPVSRTVHALQKFRRQKEAVRHILRR
jgi:hypothetical protein